MNTFVNNEIDKLNKLLTENVETQNKKIEGLENRAMSLRKKDLEDQKRINKKT